MNYFAKKKFASDDLTLKSRGANCIELLISQSEQEVMHQNLATNMKTLVRRVNIIYGNSQVGEKNGIVPPRGSPVLVSTLDDYRGARIENRVCLTFFYNKLCNSTITIVLLLSPFGC